MSSTGNETLDRIQQEIKETLEREEELRKNYAKFHIINNGNNDSSSGSASPIRRDSIDGPNSNGFDNHQHNVETIKIAPLSPKQPMKNGSSSNGFRKFSPNPSATKGVMHKFLKMRGKLNLVTVTPNNNSPVNQSTWTTPTSPNDVFEPAKVTLEPGKPIRNGFIPAEEKMRRELVEFQKREAELRKERRKSQPDLMAALEAEAEIETNLKPARSMVQLYSTEDLTEDVYSPPASLKPARSLAELCDASDEELDTPGTHSLIMQFENMKNQQARA